MRVFCRRPWPRIPAGGRAGCVPRHRRVDYRWQFTRCARCTGHGRFAHSVDTPRLMIVGGADALVGRPSTPVSFFLFRDFPLFMLAKTYWRAFFSSAIWKRDVAQRCVGPGLGLVSKPMLAIKLTRRGIVEAFRVRAVKDFEGVIPSSFHWLSSVHEFVLVSCLLQKFRGGWKWVQNHPQILNTSCTLTGPHGERIRFLMLFFTLRSWDEST